MRENFSYQPRIYIVLNLLHEHLPPDGNHFPKTQLNSLAQHEHQFLKYHPVFIENTKNTWTRERETKKEPYCHVYYIRGCLRLPVYWLFSVKLSFKLICGQRVRKFLSFCLPRLCPGMVLFSCWTNKFISLEYNKKTER